MHQSSRKTLVALAIAFGMLVVLGIVVTAVTEVENVQVTPLAISVSDEVASISDGQTITQGFTMPQDNMIGLTVRPAFLQGKPNDGLLTITLCDSENHVIYESDVNVADMRGNAPLSISFDKLQSRNQSYRIALSAKGISPENPITLMGGSDTILGTLTLADGTESTAQSLFLSAENNIYSRAVNVAIVIWLFAIALIPAMVLCGTGKKGEEHA